MRKRWLLSFWLLLCVSAGAETSTVKCNGLVGSGKPPYILPVNTASTGQMCAGFEIRSYYSSKADIAYGCGECCRTSLRKARFESGQTGPVPEFDIQQCAGNCAGCTEIVPSPRWGSSVKALCLTESCRTDVPGALGGDVSCFQIDMSYSYRVKTFIEDVTYPLCHVPVSSKSSRTTPTPSVAPAPPARPPAPPRLPPRPGRPPFSGGGTGGPGGTGGTTCCCPDFTGGGSAFNGRCVASSAACDRSVERATAQSCTVGNSCLCGGTR